MNIKIIRSNAFGTPRVSKCAKVLFDAGHSVTIVRWDRQINEVSGKYASFLRGIPIVSIKTLKAKSNEFYTNYKARLLYIFKVFMYAINSKGLYHCVDFDSAFPIYLASLISSKIIYNYDIADYLEDYDTKAPSIIKKTIRSLDKRVQKHSRFIILPDRNRLKKIDSRNISKTVIVNNAPAVVPEGVYKDQIKFEVDEKKINVFYYGVLSNDRGLDFILEAAKKYKDKYKFYIAGKGKLERVIKEEKNICFLGELEYEKCLSILSYMDISYMVYNPKIPANKVAAPNKFYEAVLFGVPIIVAKGTSVDIKTEEHNLGYVISYGSDSLFDLLDNLSKDQIKQIKSNQAKYSEEFSFDSSKQNLIRIYSKQRVELDGI